MSLEPCLPCDCAFPIAPIGEQGPPGNPGPAGPRGPQGPSGGTGGFAGVEDVEAMQAIAPGEISDFDIVATNGYWESGDGGEARYRYISTATDIVDGGSVIAPTSGVGRFFLLHEGEFNAFQFGCKANMDYSYFKGSLTAPIPWDDTSYLQAAIDYSSRSGARLFIPEGYYRITSGLVIKKGWGIHVYGKLFNYTTNTLNAPPYNTANLFLQTVLVRDMPALVNQPVLTVRGRQTSADADWMDYDPNAANRHTGSKISDLVLAARAIRDTHSAPMWLIKRVGRCEFENITVFQAPWIGLEAYALDDSRFTRCFFYVCGNFSTGSYAVKLHRQVAAVPGVEDLLPQTNTVHFDQCDWEGNFYGNFETANSASGETKSIVGLYFNGGLMKTVGVIASGKNAISLYSVDSCRLDLDACNISYNQTLGAFFPGPYTANEILKLDNCNNIYGTLFMQHTGEPPAPAVGKLVLSKFITGINCTGINLRASMFSNYVPSGDVMAEFTGTSKEINVVGSMLFPTRAERKLICNYPDGALGALGVLLGADFSDTNNQLIRIDAARWRPTRVVVENASVSMSVAAGGIYTVDVPPKTGTQIVAAAQTYAGLTGPTKAIDLTVNVPNDVQTVQSIWLSLTTGQTLPAAKVATQITSSGLLATFNSVAHGFQVGNKVTVSGATETAYNGTFMVVTVAANSFTYWMATVASASPATGGPLQAVLVPTADVWVYGDVIEQ